MLQFIIVDKQTGKLLTHRNGQKSSRPTTAVFSCVDYLYLLLYKQMFTLVWLYRFTVHPNITYVPFR